MMNQSIDNRVRAKCWLNSEPCGLFCGLVTWGLVIYGQVAFTFFLVLPWMGPSIIGVLNIFVFNFVSCLAIVSHYKGTQVFFVHAVVYSTSFEAMTTDPGAVPRDAVPLPHDDEEADYEAGDK
jgi:hypothetical protein